MACAKMHKKARKEQRKLINKEIQKMYDEYGSEAYFCGSSCSECDSHNHQESEYNENQPDFERDPTEEQK